MDSYIYVLKKDVNMNMYLNEAKIHPWDSGTIEARPFSASGSPG